MQNHSQRSDAIGSIIGGGDSKSLRGFPRKWMPVSDWLGAHRPLDLICGACAIIAVLAVIFHAFS